MSGRVVHLIHLGLQLIVTAEVFCIQSSIGLIAVEFQAKRIFTSSCLKSSSVSDVYALKEAMDNTHWTRLKIHGIIGSLMVDGVIISWTLRTSRVAILILLVPTFTKYGVPISIICHL